jgi:drug/metabolite transporter (DMT)-like permease
MKEFFKSFVFSSFTCVVIFGGWFVIGFMQMDNASKHWLQSISFMVLVLFVIIGNILFFSSLRSTSNGGTSLFALFAPLLSVTTGLIGLVLLRNEHFSIQQLGCILFTAMGFVGIILKMINARQTSQ